MTTQQQDIHGDMLIGDVLSMLPESAQIMEDFGLHCTSCSVNAFEPLKMGAMSHGLDEEVVDDMISRINDLAIARKKRIPEDSIYVTAKAAEEIQKFAKGEEKEGWPLRITAKDNAGMEPAYAMDFVEAADKDDASFEFHDVTILLDKESLKNMGGAEVDYLNTPYGSGFKITNPQFAGKNAPSGGGCGCGKGACATGEGECCKTSDSGGCC